MLQVFHPPVYKPADSNPSIKVGYYVKETTTYYSCGGMLFGSLFATFIFYGPNSIRTL